MRCVWPRGSRKGSLGPGLTRREYHFDGTHVLDVRPWEVASLFGALVVPEEPAEALGMLRAAVFVALHGQQRGLADSQKISRLQIQVLFLVLRERIEGEVLKAFSGHFVGEVTLKMATEQRIRWCSPCPTATTRFGYTEILLGHPKAAVVWWLGQSGAGGEEEGTGKESHPKLRSIFKN